VVQALAALTAIHGCGQLSFMISSASIRQAAGMRLWSGVLAVAGALSGAVAVGPVSAQAACLSSEQMREAIFAGQAVPADTATRAAREAGAGDIVRVRLCQDDKRLIYHVVTLHRDGRVGHVTVDGSSGKVANVR
jgi:hypothetical protein